MLVVLSNYLFAIAGTEGTDWQVKGVALAGYTVATLCEMALLPRFFGPV